MRAWRRALMRACASRSTRARSSGVCVGAGGGGCNCGVAGCWAGAGVASDCAPAGRQTRKHCETRKREKIRRRAVPSRRLPLTTKFDASTTRLPLGTVKKLKTGKFGGTPSIRAFSLPVCTDDSREGRHFLREKRGRDRLLHIDRK